MAEQAGFSLTRVFDAPRDRVWREWTEAAAFADWFGGPQCEVPLNSVVMEVRPGGALRLTMLIGSREVHWHGEYREVVEPERLVFAISDQPGDDRFELVTVVLTDLGDGRTEMYFEQRGYLEPEFYETTKRGWGGFFDRVDERLAAG
jgi:uncharacterized protein YndB with AHSA1/START domain